MTEKPIVFVSHSKSDTELVEAIGSALRDADVRPIFYGDFANSAESDMSISAAEEIAQLISQSCAVFILLGKNVSGLSHTQGWVGYEVGIASVKSREEKKHALYPIGSVFLVEDISQCYGAAIPHVDHVYLFDFSNEAHWKGVEIFARLISFFYRPAEERNIAPLSTPDEHEFRLRSFNCQFRCPWEGCRTRYELWIYKDNYQAALEPPSSIMCSVCRKQVRVVQSPSGSLAFEKGN